MKRKIFAVMLAALLLLSGCGQGNKPAQSSVGSNSGVQSVAGSNPDAQPAADLLTRIQERGGDHRCHRGQLGALDLPRRE